jgi:hypothetical protein
MPNKVEKFQCLSIDSGIVTGDSGNVTADSGKSPEIGHVQTESAVTFARNERSRSNGISGHVRAEYANVHRL